MSPNKGKFCTHYSPLISHTHSTFIPPKPNNFLDYIPKLSQRFVARNPMIILQYIKRVQPVPRPVRKQTLIHLISVHG